MVFSNNLIMGAAGASGAGYTIDQSIRFNDNDTAYLDNTSYSGSPTSGTDCTFSFWVKRCNLSTTQCLFFGGNPSGSTWEIIRFESDNQFRVGQASSAYDLTTSQVFRDVGAWSHFVVAFDTDNGTAADRIKIYHNGSRITDFSLETNPSSGYVTNFNTGGAGEFIRIGYQGGGSNPSDVYLAEINFVDGQALDPTSFGKTNADTGQWVPVSYTGSYGTNGFYITGADSADLGADDSGNGNDFTSSGLTSADQRLDTPTLNKATLNGVNLYTTGSVLSDGNLTVTNSGTSGFWRRAYATQALSYKTYWEVHADNLGSLNMGLSSLKNPNGGINNPAGNFGAGIQNNEAFVTGSYANESSGSRTFPISTGNYVMLAFDPDRGALWAGTEGTWKDGTASSASSATILAEIEGTGTSYALFTGIDADDAIPHIAQYSTSVATARFSSEDWEGTAPTGYEQLAPSSLPDPTIADPSAYFQTTLYTGNGTAIGSGGNAVDQSGNNTFQPDFVWIKNRDATDNHMLYDAVRGATKDLHSNSTAAEVTDTEGLSTFDTDGFTVGSNVAVNTNTENYAAWQWLADNTAGSSNTDGSITSTVSANTTSGFSIVSYTGTGSAATVGHGLGVAPSMIIAKNLSTTSNWSGYHVELGATKTINLNETAAAQTSSGNWNNTEPTTSVFSVNTATGTNGSGNSIVAYCFAEVEGFSKFGTYKGNGSTNGPFIYTGFMPEFIMVKSSSNSGTNWDMLDATREPFNDRGDQFEANTSDAEANNDHNCDFLSNGFKWRDGSGSNNGSGYTIVYMAFARSPFKTSNAQ